MKLKDISIVRKIIREDGDSFWIEKDNDYLFLEIVRMLNRRNLDLVLVVKKKE